MSTANNPPLLLITHPRSASNLFMRILSLPDHPNVLAAESGGYFFYPALSHLRAARLLDRTPEHWTDQETSAMQQVFQSCTDNFRHLISAAQAAGKRAVIKEHAPFLIRPEVRADFVHGRGQRRRRQQQQPQPQPKLIATASKMNIQIGEDSHSSTPGNGNEAVLPDEVLLQCVPAFLIRHPALAFPSYYRVRRSFADGDCQKLESMMNDLAAICTLRWTRSLYDWYIAAWEGQGQQRSPPILLEADDLIERPELARHFCDLVGLDSTRVRFEWEAVVDPEELAEHPIRRHTRTTLMASSGTITQGKTFRGLSVEGEAVKWRAEFGDYVATRLLHWVQEAMPDYEYLWGRRVVW
ncbi:uncharacterized protein BO66DRAFT_322049 [Aspergillus aculeatinus CBS 121060]|uniref:Uncharacterized protein n=1 Tax=Aspergillus aculeatinus CBS 121060 TaxID=1448322 RepID=A0ACD1HAC2_9EURO|nr:hypothetical protein BO66DRAFT_322049 [Aspergillus aculeatinus CBS 121060]RAH70523.1 hypothetical protein BO66DRAFT_322049 [Aspergillus aculeatinus CBS 121060]